MATIVTKNSSTASAVPTTSDLVQGELAVNVADKRIFTENASTQIVELGTNPSTITTATATVTGTLTANGTFASSNAVLTGGTVNGVVIGGSTPLAITGTTVTANTGFVGGLTGDVTGNLTGNVTGNVTGDLTGDVTGNLTASTGTTTVNNLVVNGTVDFTDTKLTNISTPTADSDAANKAYVDTSVSNVIAAAPAALDTLNELAAALGDDANFSTTMTNSLAGKLNLSGGTMTGAIAMGTAKITGLGDPTSAQDAATKTYVDTQDATKLSTTGGTMSGAIAMGTNKITGAGDPTAAQDVATKAYTDSILGSATSAAASATAAANSATAAASSASAASTSETNASASASASASSASEAATSYDNFDDRYLGQKASDPSVDNDGDALLTGALYFNTASNSMKVYSGSAWVDVAPVATSVTVSQISDLTATATELNYTDGVTSAIQTQLDNKEPADATILKDADIGVTVQAYDADTAKYDDTTANFTGTLQNGGSNVVVDSDIGSSVLGYVAPSTSGNVLTSNGSAWTSAAPAGGGAWELLHTTTITSQSSFIVITSPFSSTYDNYRIHFDGLDSTNFSPVDFEFWLRKGGANKTTNYKTTSFETADTTINDTTNTQGFVIGRIGSVTQTGMYCSGFVEINSANTTSSQGRSQLFQSQMSFPVNSSGTPWLKFLIGNQGDSGAIDGITLNIGSGDFQAGTIKVYGLKKS
jgi:hypothetical protein